MVAAFFDVDGTLTATNVLMPLDWFMKAYLPKWRYLLWLGKLTFHIPVYFVADQIDRKLFVQIFFRQYKGINAEKAKAWYQENFDAFIKPRIYSDALRQIQWHRDQRHKIVLVTGGLDFVIEPLANWIRADLIAAKLEEIDGKFTGMLIGEPLIGDGKASAVISYANEHKIDLTKSYAYGDSVSDAPMLACVGNPVAVNPDRRLRQIAIERGWRIVQWR
ncbi:MAG: HAD-IB family hydrolase [Armatimonadetes bacterium]|nr:HAD-IB family hydrolase [Armatimonadota bacterium]MCX7969502.1 HAD-IB family hydrolase [Armatimonadota bacterium]MDW8144234.1 HAD-IB family hydrolase [Armatimonadota bacterium]